jgi:hypothetical protein
VVDHQFDPWSGQTKDFKISQGCNIKGKEQKLVGSESGKYVREE